MLHKRASHGLIKFENNVYAFGGVKDDFLASAERYDIIQNSWDLVADMPLPGNCNSCVRVVDFIFISSYHFTLLKFSPKTQSYTTLPLEFQNGRKLIVSTDDKIFLLLRSGIYQISENGEICETVKAGSEWDIE